MFGCHNCKRKPRKNERYEESACASCPAACDPENLSYVRFDVDRLPALYDSCDCLSEVYDKTFSPDEWISALSQTGLGHT